MPEGLSGELEGKVNRFLSCLYQVSFMAELYDVYNKVFDEPITGLTTEMGPILMELGEISLREQDQHLMFNGFRLRADNTTFMRHRELARWLGTREIRGITFYSALNENQWRGLMKAITRASRKAADAFDKLVNALRLEGITQVELVKRERTSAPQIVRKIELNRRDFAIQAMARVSMLLQLWVENHATPAKRDFLSAKLKRCVQDLVVMVLRGDYKYIGFVNNLVESGSLWEQSVNVAILSIAIGARAGMNRPRLLELAMGALFRNLGLSFLPDALMRKVGPFSPEEREIFSRHPTEAIRVLLGSRQFHEELLKRILVVADRHGEFNPVQHPNSRIVAVAERFGAMVRGRNYRPAYFPDAAVLAVSKMAGKIFDPEVVHLFVHVMGLYPPGTCVKLSSGEIAVVFHPNPDGSGFLQPIVRVVRDAQGEEVWPPPVVDLAAVDPKRTIVGSVAPKDYLVLVARVLAADEPVPVGAAQPE